MERHARACLFLAGAVERCGGRSGDLGWKGGLCASWWLWLEKPLVPQSQCYHSCKGEQKPAPSALQDHTVLPPWEDLCGFSLPRAGRSGWV